MPRNRDAGSIPVERCNRMSVDNAGTYFFGPPPSQAQLALMAPAGAVTQSMEGDKARVSVAWPDATLVVTIDPAWNRDKQLRGIRAWLLHFPENERKAPAVQGLLADLDRTTTCYGGVITPSYDAGGKVVAFLKAMIAPTGGFFFTHQSFYGPDGARIGGVDGDPATMGASVGRD
jgi:hypothetical protein